MMKSPMSRRLLPFASVLLGMTVWACAEDAPTPAGPAGPATAHASVHGSMGPDMSQAQVAQVLRKLRSHTASWHNDKAAAAAGYVVPVGCSDERTEGLSALTARGMGYHTVNPAYFDPSGAVNLLQPQTLVYQLHEASGQMKLAGFDYFVPSTIRGPDEDPPVLEELDMPLMWNDAHDGWVAHIWPWLHNPDGMFENFNANVPLCGCEVTPTAPLCTP